MEKVGRKIASMTVFCKEYFRIEKWVSYYKEYSSEIAYHIIINNGKIEDSELLKRYFPNSIILYSPSPNLLAAYNKGLEYIIQSTDAEIVMQITNDIRFKSGSIAELKKRLFADNNIGVIGPVIFKKESNVIESFGWILQKKSSFGEPLYKNEIWENIESKIPDCMQVTFIPAGAIMVKLEAWKKIGFQDELLYMYEDERDFALNMSKFGYKEVVTPKAQAWHQHEFPPGEKNRSYSSAYYVSRNRIYITSKHFGKYYAFREFCGCLGYNFLLVLSHILRFQFKKMKWDIINIRGLWAGLLGKMK